MVTISTERQSDIAAREALLDRAFGPRRRRKTAERLRDGRLPSDGLAFSAHGDDGRFVGTVRLWDIEAGSAGAALLLGPIAIDESMRGQGVAAALVNRAIAEAAARGHRAILLVGDEPYYRRFGFTRSAVEDLRLPGPVDRDRFLGLELEEGALLNANGVLFATGLIEEAAPVAVPSTARRKRG